jgi:hypothetical protein
MSRPRVADRGDGLQIWRVAANMLNKQSRTTDSGWSSCMGFGRGITTPTVKKLLFRNDQQSLRTGRIFWHDLSTGKWIWDLSLELYVYIHFPWFSHWKICFSRNGLVRQQILNSKRPSIWRISHLFLSGNCVPPAVTFNNSALGPELGLILFSL